MCVCVCVREREGERGRGRERERLELWTYNYNTYYNAMIAHITWTLSTPDNLTFDIHVNNICLKASRQISALHRLTGFLDLPSRKAIYDSFIVSNFSYCPLVCFFTSRASITKIQKLLERALRFVLKDSISDYDTLLSKGGVDSFRISSLKIMAVEIYKILNGMNPEYLSPLFSRSTTPYKLRDNKSWSSQLNAQPLMELNHWPIIGRIYGIRCLLM